MYLRKFFRLAFVCLAALLMIGACGGDDDDSGAATSSSSSASLPTGELTAIGNSTLKDELIPKLLNVMDLPDGWELVSTDEHPHQGSIFCDTPFEGATAPLVRLTRVFKNGDDGPVLSQRISAYPEGEAEEVMDAFREATEGCDEWTKITQAGTTQTWNLRPLDIELPEEDSIALDLPSTVGSISITNHFVMVREGDVITIVGYSTLSADQIESSEIEQFARMAADKLR